MMIFSQYMESLLGLLLFLAASPFAVFFSALNVVWTFVFSFRLLRSYSLCVCYFCAPCAGFLLGICCRQLQSNATKLEAENAKLKYRVKILERSLNEELEKKA